MRHLAALAAAALALSSVPAVAGCGPRADRLGGTSSGQQGSAPTQPVPATATGGGPAGTLDPGQLDAELRTALAEAKAVRALLRSL